MGLTIGWLRQLRTMWQAATMTSPNCQPVHLVMRRALPHFFRPICRSACSGRPSRPGDLATSAPQGCLPHFDRQPNFCGNLATGVSEGLGPTGNTIPLPAGFRACNSLIQLSRCPGYLRFRRRMSSSCSGRTLLTNLVTIKSATPLPFEGGPAVHTLPWSGTLLGFLSVPEERKIPAAGGAVDFRLSRNRVSNGLV